MKKKSSILIAIESFWDGGAEMFAIRLAKSLALENNVIFIELYPYRTILKKQKKQLEKSNVKLIQIGNTFLKKLTNEFEKAQFTSLASKLNFLHDKICIWQSKLILWHYKIDIVNSHSWDSDFYFSKLKIKSSFKLISTFHGHYEFLRNRRTNFEIDTRFSLSQIDNIVYTTDSHLSIINHFNFPLINATKIFYGIDVNICQKFTKYFAGHTLKIVMVARGIKEKGWEEAIFAVKLIYEKYPGRVLLNIVGEGNYLDRLKSEYNHEAIVFHGFHHDVSSFIIQCDIGILPSFYEAESLPNSIIEYLSYGKPVISTNIGAIKEMIQYDGQIAGYLLELINGKVDINLLANCIESYFLDSSLVEIHSKLALKAAEKFAMKNCSSEYINLFNRSFS